jgi:hypothetical protein
MIPDIWGVVLLAVVGVPLAAVLHELTHIVVIWPVAEHIEIDPSGQAVAAEIPDTHLGQTVADVTGFAPAIIGTLVVLGFTHAGAPWPAPWDSPTGIMLWGVWVVYSAAGGLSDYVPSISRTRARARGNETDDLPVRGAGDGATEVNDGSD